jgi:hypothetical protein
VLAALFDEFGIGWGHGIGEKNGRSFALVVVPAYRRNDKEAHKNKIKRVYCIVFAVMMRVMKNFPFFVGCGSDRRRDHGDKQSSRN